MTLPESTVATTPETYTFGKYLYALSVGGKLDELPPLKMMSQMEADGINDQIQGGEWIKVEVLPIPHGFATAAPPPAMGGLPEGLTTTQSYGAYDIDYGHNIPETHAPILHERDEDCPKRGCIEVEVMPQGTRDRLGELEGREAVAWAVAYDGAITGNLFPSEKGARRCMEQLNTQFPNEKREIFSLVIGARDGVEG